MMPHWKLFLIGKRIGKNVFSILLTFHSPSLYSLQGDLTWWILPVKAVHHFQLSAEVLLCQMVQHSSINKALHKITSVLRQAQARQPLVTNPLMIHVAICKGLE